MKLYFVHSPHYEDLLRERQVPIIVSYGRLDRTLELPKGFPEIMIDSGGYQLQSGTATREVYVEGYGLWLNLTLQRRPEVKYYFNLDLQNDPVQSLANLLYLESVGLHPLPVFQANWDFSYIQEMARKYDYIGIGGIARLSKPQTKNVLSWIFQNFPDKKFHTLGVGLSGIQIFKSLPPYSCDISTWLSPARYGHEIQIHGSDFIRERKLPDDVRMRIRTDKKFERELVGQAIDRIQEFSEKISDSKSPYIGILFKEVEE